MNYYVLCWWYLISRQSSSNLEKLYYIKNEITDINSLKIYRASWIFISACAIRSFFPRIDGTRTCFFDSWISYPLIGRICATFGEIAFVYQLTFTTKIFAHKLKCYNIYKLMNMIMILICIAQIFCWCGVLYQQNILHVIEESIWAGCMIIIGLSYFYFYDLTDNLKTKRYFMVAFIISVIYYVFMISVDIPMYYNRIENISYLNNTIYNQCVENKLYNKIKEMASCNNISQSYNTWVNEIPWMTGYFIGATWLSINIINFHKLSID